MSVSAVLRWQGSPNGYELGVCIDWRKNLSNFEVLKSKILTGVEAPTGRGACLVVINYNYGRYLRDCLRSLEEQTYPNFRVIVVDDGSTDDSGAILRDWVQSTQCSAEVLLKGENRGPAHSYNLAIDRLAPADEFVSFIDADDVYLPTKTSLQIRAFASLGPEYGVVCSDVEIGDERLGKRVLRRRDNVPNPLIVNMLRRGSYLPLNATLIRASALQRLDESLAVCDLQLWYPIARRWRVGYSPGVVGVIRRHNMSMSAPLGGVVDDNRLTLLGRYAETSDERRAARARGRRIILRVVRAGVSIDRPSLFAYGIGARDPLALLALCWQLLPESDCMARALRPVQWWRFVSRRLNSCSP
jgi:hypothetical protein